MPYVDRCSSNFLTNPATYDYKKNDFSHLAGWVPASAGKATTPSPQQEVLYCWGCHSNAGTGALRNPGALTFTYTNKATVTYPDISGSNVCMACHTGRETGDSIKNDPDADGIRSFLNSHYLAAGGQLFGTTGYEYAGLSYANPSFFAHDKIGSSAAPGTGSNGPCAGCHMSTPNSHSFTNVTKDAAGAITAITSTACAACHTGNFTLTPAKLTEEDEEYKAAIAASRAVMASKGLTSSKRIPTGIRIPPEVLRTPSPTGRVCTASPNGRTSWERPSTSTCCSTIRADMPTTGTT